MVARDIETLLAEHPFFKDMVPGYRALIAGCGTNVHFNAGEFIAKAGDPANQFLAIRHGRVSIEIHAPERGPVILQTLEAEDIVGWSWLVPPYRWTFDVRAMDPVRAISFDAECLRAKCERDPAMGYDFLKRFAQVFIDRLTAARLQLMDLYGSGTL